MYDRTSQLFPPGLTASETTAFDSFAVFIVSRDVH